MKGGVGLLVELACSKASVLSAACAESRACYVGVHGNLEKVATQNHVADLVNQVMEDLKMTRSASDRELGEVHLFCHVHMSLPCTGGSPLQNFSGAKRVPEHERKFLELLAACEKLLDRLVERHPELPMSFELPNSNRYWTHPKLQAFVQARIPFRSVVHACAMGIEGLPDYPSRKRSGSCQVLRSLVNVLRSVFIVLVISTHHSTFLTFICQKNTPGSLPDFLCGCSHYLPSGDRWRRSHADFIA